MSKLKEKFAWFFESNRDKHFYLGIVCGFIFTILFGLGIASGMEFKDCHHANGNKPIKEWSWKYWDWVDWLCTVVGSLLGNAIMVVLLLLL